MLTCGLMRKFDEKNLKANEAVFVGNIALADVLNGKIFLYKNPYHKPDTDRPLYDVAFQYEGSTRPAMKLGAAWIKNNVETGDFLSITLDQPRWPKAISLAVFPPEGKDVDWRVVWSRPRGARVQQRGAEPQVQDDEIPY